MSRYLVLDKVTKIYDSNNEKVHSLIDISLEVEPNEFLCVIGPSGCGKTTLLRLIAGLDTPTTGKIMLDGMNIDGPSPERGMVFQEFSLFPWRNVLKNVEFGLEILGFENKREIAEHYLSLVGLNKVKNKYPYELSGGMKQRVAIARSIATNPSILLMDEPFGSLDAQTRNIIQDELLKIWEIEKKTVIFVTHSVDEALYLADRIIIMSRSPGRIIEEIKVDVKRPRERTDPTIVKERYRILKLLGVEIKKIANI